VTHLLLRRHRRRRHCKTNIHITGISREKIDKRKNATYREEKAESNKQISILTRSIIERKPDMQDQAKRKDYPTQDPQDRLMIFQHQMFLNERVIQAGCEE
jgi:hypothetical protein